MKPAPLALALAAALAPAFATAASPIASIAKEWTFSHAANPGQASEIVSFDALTNTLWVAGVVGVDVLNASTGGLIEHIDVTGMGYINSVAVKNGVAAFAIEDKNTRSNPGLVAFYDTATRTNTGTVAVGALPDMLTFTPDGSRLLVANEGTPNPFADAPYVTPDPVGSVSIIDMNSRSVSATVSFAAAPQTGSYLRTNTGMDFEPEYIAVNAAGTKAFVGLQEANGMAVIDLASNTATKVVGLGVKDFNTPGNAIDPSHKDSKIELRPAAVKGLYQPDGMASYEAGGRTYLVMANEGDTREDGADKARVKDVAALAAGAPADLKQLNVSTTDSTPGDLVTFGARSFSIRDEDGNLVYDSGNILDAKAIELGIYDDGRSDDKGVEPEGVTLLEIDGRTLAFIGLERTTKSAVAIFDITDPAHASFLDLIVGEGDISPEGVLAYQSGGQYYLAVAHEVSNTTTVYSLAPVPEPETYALMLAGLGLVGFMARRRQA